MAHIKGLSKLATHQGDGVARQEDADLIGGAVLIDQRHRCRRSARNRRRSGGMIHQDGGDAGRRVALRALDFLYKVLAQYVPTVCPHELLF